MSLKDCLKAVCVVCNCLLPRAHILSKQRHGSRSQKSSERSFVESVRLVREEAGISICIMRDCDWEAALHREAKGCRHCAKVSGDCLAL
jgi:hypothetical protein